MADLFEEARTSGSLDIEEGGTGVLRMVEIISCKIFSLRYNLADVVMFIFNSLLQSGGADLGVFAVCRHQELQTGRGSQVSF